MPIRSARRGVARAASRTWPPGCARGLEQDDVVPALGGDPGGLQAGRSGAHDDDPSARTGDSA